MKVADHHGGERESMLHLRCPECGGEVELDPADAWPGRRVGCLHCGSESFLNRDDGAEAPGNWLLSSEWVQER